MTSLNIKMFGRVKKCFVLFFVFSKKICVGVSLKWLIKVTDSQKLIEEKIKKFLESLQTEVKIEKNWEKIGKLKMLKNKIPINAC